MTEEQEEYIDIKKFESRHPESAVVVQNNGPSELMMAIQKGYDPALIEKMMDLQERQEKNEARKAYAKDMAAFKASPPEILKTKHVSYRNSKNQEVEWDHAELGEICEAIIEGLSPHNFYHNWDMHQPEKNTVRTTCIITHVMGHREQTSMSGPPDTSGGKDELKAVASTNTILQRLTLLSLTGLAAKGMDNNGSGIVDEFITEEQAHEISKIVLDKGANVGFYLKVMKTEEVSSILAKDYEKAITEAHRAKATK